MKSITYIDQRASSYRILCWTNPCIYKKKEKKKRKKKSKTTYLTLSVSRQNPYIRTQNTVRHVRMHCFLLFSVGTLSMLSSRPRLISVVDVNIACMILYQPLAYADSNIYSQRMKQRIWEKCNIWSYDNTCINNSYISSYFCKSSQGLTEKEGVVQNYIT